MHRRSILFLAGSFGALAIMRSPTLAQAEKQDSIPGPLTKGTLMTRRKTQAEILACIEQYIAAAIEGKSDRMKRVMHPDAQIFGYLDGQLLAGPMKLLYDYVDGHPGAGPQLKWAATMTDEADGVACVRVGIDDWHGHNFTDYMTLLKIDGAWKVMNKVFSHT